jgi:thiamine-phosphate pyrophosphorylase
LARLYLITDAELDPDGLLSMYDAPMLEGVGLFQLRVKGLEDVEVLKLAREFSGRCREAGVALVVNDRPDIALLVGAAGVHLGQRDLPVSGVRGIVPPGMLVGRSVRNPTQAQEAVRAGASYVALGPCFTTPAKPDLRPLGTTVLKQTVQSTDAPVCAIGGITPLNLGEVLDTKPAYVAVVSAVSRSESPQQVKRFLVETMKRDEETLPR